MERGYYHLFANGEDAKNFIVCEGDFFAAFNRVGICAANCRVVVVAFSIEDSHPHILVFGDYDEVVKFMLLYEDLSRRFILGSRKSLDGVVLRMDLLFISSPDYLRSVGCYVILQPTKDGKRVMPYDYFWGTGSMYFRTANVRSIWLFDSKGELIETVSFGSLSWREKRNLIHSSLTIPDSWLVAAGVILPCNYVDVKMFESIYSTHNCYRVFLGSNKKMGDEVIQRMSQARGVMLEDLEARKLCAQVAGELFGNSAVVRLAPDERIKLACALRQKCRLSFRQIATLVRLPETEIRKYFA